MLHFPLFEAENRAAKQGCMHAIKKEQT